MTTMTLEGFIAARLHKPVDVYLINGIKLSGMILVGCDADAVFLRPASGSMGTQMVLFSAISTIAS